MISLVLFIALGVSLFALRLGLRSSPRQMPAVSAPARVADSAPAASPDGAKAAPARASGSVPTQAADAQPGGQRLVIRAVEPTWIRVQVDEGQVTEELLQAGAVREWTAAHRFVLTVGNAGGLEVDLNGRKIPPLGAKGAVIQRLVLPQEAPGAGS